MYGLGMADAEIPFNRELFQRLCRSHGLWTLTDCAEMFGVEPSTIHRIQTGKHSPSLRLANKMREVFGLSAYLNLFPLTFEELADDYDQHQAARRKRAAGALT